MSASIYSSKSKSSKSSSTPHYLNDFSALNSVAFHRSAGKASLRKSNHSEVNTLIEASVSAVLNDTAQQYQLSHSVLLQGVWAILLSRYSGEETVTFGVTDLLHYLSQEKSDFTRNYSRNILPVKLNLPPETSFLFWLQEYQAQWMGLQVHSPTSLLSNISTDTSLIESLVVVSDYQLTTLLQSQKNNPTHSKCQLVNQENFPVKIFGYFGTELSLRLEYNSDLFTAATATRMLGHLQTLLEEIATNPHQHLSKLPILTEIERHQLLVEWNDTQTHYPKDKCVHQLFEAQVERTPNAIALVFEQEYLTYQELNNRANQLAHYLQKRGVSPDVLVGICIERSLEMIIGMLGILKAGGAYVPIDPNSPQERLNFIIQDTQIPLLLTQEKWLSCLPNNQLNIIFLDNESENIAQYSKDNLACKTSIDSLIYTIYTSGSTGKPKGVTIPHRGISNMLYWKQSTVEISTADKILQTYPFSFDASVCQIFWPLSFGGQLVLASPEGHKNTTYLVKTIKEQQITIIGLVPSILRLLLEEQGIEHCQSLKHAICGGEPLEIELVERFYERLALENVLQNEYGPTEASMVTSFWLCQGGHNSIIAPIGRPIGNFQIYILDKYLQPVPIGVPGELYIGGDGLATGYLNRPELTAEKFISNPFSKKSDARLYKTGDLTRYLPDGNIEFIGRIDNQVKIRGFRIELGEIEAVLSQHPSLCEAVVIAREDTPGNRYLVAYMVPQQEKFQSVALRAFLQKHLPHYMVPSTFVLLDKLPLTPNGKVDRRALPTPDHTSRASIETGYVAPCTSTEEALATIWADVLGLDTVGIHDNFFELGGHSLLAIQVISRVRDTFEVDLPLSYLFKTPTVSSMSTEILNLDQASTKQTISSILPIPRNQALPLSSAQQRLWFLDKLESGSTVYNMPHVFHLEGSLNKIALEQSFKEIMRRHESLRTSFRSINDQPVQIIASDLVLKLPIVDLRELSPAQKTAEVQRQVHGESQQPFDLSHPPLWRFKLLQLTPAKYLLLVTFHHTIFDGWSVGVFKQELSALYQAFCDGQPSPLPELPIQYADFSHWQHQWLQSHDLELQLGYWQQQLGGNLPVLELSTDYPRPPVQTYQGASQTILLPKNLSRALKTLSQQEEVTLSMMLLAAFKVLLSRLSGQTDIIVGSPIAGRNQTEVEQLIGFFVSTLVLRTDLSGNPSFQELLARVRNVTLGAYAHQNVSFEKLVEELQPERDLSRNPIFQVFFNSLNLADSPLELPGLATDCIKPETVSSKFDLTLYVQERGQCIQLEMVYSTDLFAVATITRMLGHLQTLLEGIAANPLQCLSELPLLTAIERHQLLVEWNETQKDYPQNKCVHQLFEAQVERTPNAVALVFEDEQLTYQELNRQSNQLAHYLQKLGVGPDVLVGICVDRSLEMVVGLLGILKAGGAYVPLDPIYPQERLAYMLSDSQIQILLTQKSLLIGLPEGKTNIICLDEDWQNIGQESDKNPHNKAIFENLAYVIYTSGSTGKPKGVAIEQKSILNYSHAILEQLPLRPHCNFALVTTIAGDLGNTVIFPALLSGGCLHVLSQERISNSMAFADYFSRHTIDCLKIVPSHLATLQLSTNLEKILPRQMLILGGEASNLEWIKELGDHNPQCTILNHYGPTEATVGVLTYRVTTLQSPLSQSLFTLPLGRPLANIQIYILDRYLQPVPIGVAGEIHIGGAGLARGYLNRPELTQEKFISNPFTDKEGSRLYKTGDLARYLPDGTVEYLGRIDNQVKIRGFRIELGEIEAALEQQVDVRQAVVIAREDRPGDKRLVGYIVPDKKHNPSISELRHVLQEKLPEYMVPNTFVLLETIPLTPNGKVDHRALPTPDTSRDVGTGYAAPCTSTEETLATIWADVLSLDKVGIHDNFFELGGHSLLAVRLFSQIEKALGKNLSLASLFQAQNIEQQAALLHPDSHSDSLSSLVELQAGNSLRSPLFCIHGVGLNVLVYRDLAINLGSDQPVYGLQASSKTTSPSWLGEIAADYIEHIRTIQPEGPYYLAGLSAGGKIALEMAQQLRQQGYEVALLAMFDTFGPNYPRLLPLIPRLLSLLNYVIRYSTPRIVNKLRHTPQKTMLKLLNATRDLPVSQQQNTGEDTQQLRNSPTLKESQPALKNNALEHWVNKLHKFVIKHSPLAFYADRVELTKIEGSLSHSILELVEVHNELTSQYIPRPYSGCITLFYGSEALPGYYRDTQLGWGEIPAEGVESYEVPGFHAEIVGHPILAERLRACIDSQIKPEMSKGRL